MKPEIQRGLRETAGIARSLWQYHADFNRARRMRTFYRLLVPAGGLVFDVGAHVGDRVRVFRSLGAEVVAVEPQPAAFRLLQWLFARSPRVHLVNAAVGETSGELILNLNLANPTVSTVSQEFVAAASSAEGWADQRWDEARLVPATTLDMLIARFGEPDFIKIDVEGFEAAALAGLSQAVRALSFEFTTIQCDVAFQCIARLEQLGPYRFNLSLGESFAMEYRRWLSASDIADVIAALPHQANSGDVYAVRRDIA